MGVFVVQMFFSVQFIFSVQNLIVNGNLLLEEISFIEVGVDICLLDDCVCFDFIYYDVSIENQIIVLFVFIFLGYIE